MPHRVFPIAPVRRFVRTLVHRRARGALLSVLLSAPLALVAPAAYADVYGYVDPDGTLHLATERLDEHYTLFLKTATRPAGASSAATTRLRRPTRR